MLGRMTDKTLNRLRPTEIAKLAQTVGTHSDGGSLYLVVRKPEQSGLGIPFQGWCYGSF